LITGLTGQDGSYLAELLLDKGYEVHGVVRRTSTPSTSRVAHLPQVITHYGDMGDSGSLNEIIKIVKPDEIYNLAAQSHVKVSFDVPEQTAETTGIGYLRLLEAVRRHHPEARIYQAGTSEMFGTSAPPQSESTVFHPRSPYGCAKLFAHSLGVNYRESYGMFIANGILFNHESPRRGENFVTRKITMAVANIRLGKQKELVLGNLDARRDWGFAGDYVEAMWRMLQAEKPGDYVVATGKTHSVKEFCEIAFKSVGLDWRDYVTTNDQFLRPAEVPDLCGDPTKIKNELGWVPKTSFDELVKMMVEHDLRIVDRA
jgi:GDPmannose 4,6-dehydratase